MEYLKLEIEEEITLHSLKVDRIEGERLEGFLDYLRVEFYGGGTCFEFACRQRPLVYYDPDFWNKISSQPDSFVYLLVRDSDWRAWKFDSKEDLQLLIAETTRYVFWLLDSARKVLVFFGDSSEVVWSCVE